MSRSVAPCVRILLLCVLVLCAAPVYAHHGKNFLLVETAQLPHPRELFVIASVALLSGPDSDQYELEPAFLYGVSEALALEAHVHFAREEHKSFHYESVAPSVHYLFPRTVGSVWKVGLSAEYEFGRDHDRAEARLVVGRLDRSNVTFNLIAEKEQGEDTEFGYAIGLRPNVERRVGFGLEALGAFERSEHEILGGFYLEPSERLSFKVGVGAGVGSEAPDWTVRAGVVWRPSR